MTSCVFALLAVGIAVVTIEAHRRRDALCELMTNAHTFIYSTGHPLYPDHWNHVLYYEGDQPEVSDFGWFWARYVQFTDLDVSCIDISSLSSLPQISTLDLRGSSHVDVVLGQLTAEMGIREVALQGSDISDLTITVLQGDAIRILRLDNTDITEASLDHLKTFEALEFLSLPEEQFSEQSLNELRRLPGLVIETSPVDLFYVNQSEDLPTCKTSADVH